jgi:ketosteroid isomerase-like protein
MVRNGQWILASLVVMFALSCSPQEPAIDVEAELQSLRSAAKAYHEAGESRNVEGLLDFYDSDSLTLPPNSQDEIGKEGFRKIAAAMVGLSGFQARFGDVQAAVSAGGDMGYTVTNMDMSFQGADGATVQEKFRDVHIWKKDPSGSWKVAVDVWNSKLPLAPAQ